MNAKMKGLFKGLRYISSIFEPDEKEPEIVIGNPTDVKHVSHIGCDGPLEDSAPSWMKEFKSSQVSHSAPLNIIDPIQTPDIISLSGELKPKHFKEKHSSSDIPHASKSGRRHAKELSEDTLETNSPAREKSSRSSRRRSAKDLSETSHSNKHLQIQETVTGSESPARNLPDKHSRRRRELSENANSNKQLQLQDVTIGSESPARDNSKHSRRRGAKELSENANSNKQLHLQDVTFGSESPARNMPHISKGSRRSTKDLSENTNSSRQLPIQDGSIAGSESENSKSSRRSSTKQLAENANSHRKLQVQDLTIGSESPARNTKTSRGKESKELYGVGSGSGLTSSRLKSKQSVPEPQSSIKSVMSNEYSVGSQNKEDKERVRISQWN